MDDDEEARVMQMLRDAWESRLRAEHAARAREDHLWLAVSLCRKVGVIGDLSLTEQHAVGRSTSITLESDNGEHYLVEFDGVDAPDGVRLLLICACCDSPYSLPTFQRRSELTRARTTGADGTCWECAAAALAG